MGLGDLFKALSKHIQQDDSEHDSDSLKHHASNSPRIELTAPAGYYLSYQYDDVKFYPPQELISKVNKKVLSPGAEITLVQETRNKQDNRAVALYISMYKIGYMLRGTLQDMANDYIENGWPIKVILSDLRFVSGEYRGHINIFFYRKSANPKLLGSSDIDIKSIQPTNPEAIPDTPLTGKNIVFSGLFSLPLDQMMQKAVDAGAVLKSRVTKNVNYLVVGEQKEEFLNEKGLSSKESTAMKLMKQGEVDIKIIGEEAFLKLIHKESEK